MDESIVKHLDAPPKVLKLSEAIRIGAKIRPQARGELFKNGASCVLGAAYEGITGKTCKFWEYNLLTEQFPILGVGGYLNEFGTSLHRLNDIEKMTREAIADRLKAMGY